MVIPYSMLLGINGSKTMNYGLILGKIQYVTCRIILNRKHAKGDGAELLSYHKASPG